MNKNILIALAVLVVVGFGAYYFVFSTGSNAPSVYTPPTTNYSSTNTPAPTTQTPATQPPTTQAPPAPVSNTPPASTVSNAAVGIQNFSFSPSQVSVKAGTKVTWTNKDGTAHTVTSNSGAFNSGTLNPGATFSFTFNIPGTYSYHCNFHPSMTASIVVTQ